MDLGKILADGREKKNADRNRKRLEGALETVKRLKALRIAGTEIKNLIVRLCYEAGVYIAFALKHPDAFYDPALVDSLEKSLASVNAFLKDENNRAAERHFYGNGGVCAEQDGAASSGVLAVLEECAAAFREKNRINNAGDLDRIIRDVDD
ncbi:MAG: hypothetical protein LBI67_06275 [Treponema sp.]|jgi:hypothetical protein|nr:hypothetical protein [Treponema sp.]